jgi:hypothetical protein
MNNITINIESAFNDISEYVKPIADFDGYYIFRNGDILSIRNKIPKFLKASIGTIGYYVVNLRNTSGTKQKYIHNLLYSHFKEPIKEEYVIDHIDRDQTNNNLDNLRMVVKRINSLNSDRIYNSTSKIKHIAFRSNKSGNYKYIEVSFMIIGKKKSKCFKYENQNKGIILKKAIKYRDKFIKKNKHLFL